ncbi:hypothetical protein NCCP2716_23540 [Sporosarcina sp. NCCP-2716]|uniref:hypothetical protein n=1 Tax=Sporosarcina sp. NCCP-2716 TaxID=2943679 RepID=UPI00203B6314|nr:hypothetical protein [Sporosarcina sp. NCCP-2716]GKV69856.1 hypothetical protein NCCP2716_23540 [Sporosarcina sp. NCCP-2716]
MEKVITIDGRDVRFKSTAATPLRYKAQFQSDFFVDLMAMSALSRLQKKNGELDMATLKNLDFDVFYNLLWVFAKTADKDLPDPMTWLDGFEEFPVFEIVQDIQELIEKNLQSKKK